MGIDKQLQVLNINLGNKLKLTKNLMNLLKLKKLPNLMSRKEVLLEKQNRLVFMKELVSKVLIITTKEKPEKI